MKFIVDYWGHIVGVRIQADMRREMFGHLEKLPISFSMKTRAACS